MSRPVVWVGNIERATQGNRAFRRVVATGRYQQLVFMSLPPGIDIGLEVHRTVDQFLRIERGTGVFTFSTPDLRSKRLRRIIVREGDAMFVPAGTWHNLQNIASATPLQLYTLYAPPEHPPNTLQTSKS